MGGRVLKTCVCGHRKIFHEPHGCIRERCDCRRFEAVQPKKKYKEQLPENVYGLGRITPKRDLWNQ